MTNPASSQVALVTGGGRGIGRALALTLADQGVAVGLVGRHPDTLEQVAAEIDGGAFAIAADVTNPVMVRRAVEVIEKQLGPIDLLADNAGLREPQPDEPWLADPDAWWEVVEVNLHGPMLLAQAVLPGMLERGRGRIFEVASGVGLRPEPRFSAYSVSKAAQLRWVDNLAAALGPETGVRVLAVSPGLIRTDMTEGMWEGLPDSAYGSVDAICEALRRCCAGDLDPLHGWFVHAARDDLDTLLRDAATAGDDARRLRLSPYSDADPLS